MAQNITLLGASYLDVPAVTLPKTGGGTAQFDDTTDANATAADILFGKTAYVNGVKLTGTGDGGSGGTSTSDNVIFIDYDGTVLHSYSKADFLALTEMPSNPSHSGLISQGWNWSLADAKAQVNAMGGCTIGQLYITDDGKTRLYCHFEDERCSPWLQLYPNGTVTIDWGDGSSTDTLTGTSLSTIKSVQHEYAAGGNYVITLEISGTARVQGSSANTNYSGSYLLHHSDGIGSTYPSVVYRNAVHKIELGSGLIIGNGAFKSMYSLETVSVPKSATVSQYAFCNCYSLASISIPDGVTSIDGYAFQNCYGLTSISIPDGVTRIGTDAFQYCYGLTSINIPDSVTDIGSNAFQNCYGLPSIVIPDGVTSIAGYAFQNCTSLTSINIPDGVKGIVAYTFNGCNSLTSINIPDGVTSIYSFAFQNCKSLASISIPDSVTSIGNSVFQYCYRLTSINIPDSVTSIGSSAFQYCASLTSINIPDGVTSIGANVFQYCYRLTSINIPDSVTSIGASAFQNCYSLASISIPDSVTSIGANAFNGCYGMAEYHFNSQTPPALANTNAFANIQSDCKIYVPAGCLSAYSSATNWSTYASYMIEESA